MILPYQIFIFLKLDAERGRAVGPRACKVRGKDPSVLSREETVEDEKSHVEAEKRVKSKLPLSSPPSPTCLFANTRFFHHARM